MLRAAAILFASLALATPAAADRVSVHATASADVAATDNASSSQGGNRQADMLFTARPGMLFTYALPRMVQELSAEVELRQALRDDQPAVGLRGGWRALFLTGPRSELGVTANASSTLLSAASAATDPSQTMVQLQPVGQIDVIQGDVAALGSYTATRELRLSQTVFARASRADDNATMVSTSLEVGTGISIDRTFRNDSLSVEAGVSVLRLERDATAAAAMGSSLDRQVDPRIRGLWRHDVNRRMSGSLDGGLVIVVPYGTDPDNPTAKRSAGAFPTAGAQAAYTDLWGLTTIAVRRDVTPNLLVAANTVNTTASLAAAIPLFWLEETRRREPALAAMGSLGVQRTQLIASETSMLQSSFNVARVDVGLQYMPRPGLTYSARYELLYQSGDRAAVMPTTGFFRNTVFVAAAIRYPADVAARVPRQRSVRADRKDLSPGGAELVIPDLSSGQGD